MLNFKSRPQYIFACNFVGSSDFCVLKALKPMATAAEVVSKTENKSMVEAKTGIAFPTVLDTKKKLAGVGVRKKKLLGLASLKVYAFGIYVDEKSLKQKLKDKYNESTKLNVNKEFYEDVMGCDVGLTVRIVVVFAGLSMGLVRSNFQETVAARIKKLNGGKHSEELSKRMMSDMNDDVKISRGTIIDITRLPGHVLQTKVGAEVVGQVQSELLCRAIFDLYLGEEPFEEDAKVNIGLALLSLLRS
eukprot:Gb_17645 [translate_table: standard]